MFQNPVPMVILVLIVVAVAAVAGAKHLRRVGDFAGAVVQPTEREIWAMEEIVYDILDTLEQRGQSEEYQLEVLRSTKKLGKFPPCLKGLDLNTPADLATVRSTLNASLATRDTSR